MRAVTSFLGVLAALVPAACTGTTPRAAAAVAHVSTDSLTSVLQAQLDSFRIALNAPGASLAVALPDGRVIAVASGMSDTVRKIPLRVHDRLLLGSVGKTYVAAVALQLVGEGKLDLDAPIARYLGGERWFARLPNADAITVRQLMNHTSGLVRYEFLPTAAEILRQQPYKVWTPVDRLSLIFDLKAPFAAGAGWQYSDTNYIVLGMILERITGRAYDDLLRERILAVHGLRNTVPADRPEIPGLVNGYAGPRNALGGYDASLVDGRLAINPQFEWTGGGVAATASDLAQWARLLYEGRAFPPRLLPDMLSGVPARLGPNTSYGLGVMIYETAAGRVYGHSGFFPGYATEMIYLPEAKVGAALLVNVSDPYPRGMMPFLHTSARAVR